MSRTRRLPPRCDRACVGTEAGRAARIGTAPRSCSRRPPSRRPAVARTHRSPFHPHPPEVLLGPEPCHTPVGEAAPSGEPGTLVAESAGVWCNGRSPPTDYEAGRERFPSRQARGTDQHGACGSRGDTGIRVRAPAQHRRGSCARRLRRRVPPRRPTLRRAGREGAVVASPSATGATAKVFGAILPGRVPARRRSRRRSRHDGPSDRRCQRVRPHPRSRGHRRNPRPNTRPPRSQAIPTTSPGRVSTADTVRRSSGCADDPPGDSA